ncbi:helicase-related protein [Streptosporangium sp. NBC_01639]|uniref:helicase-related protein n=1 Tax=Streptosporangium sp. NBC_01639 TaxID=2975948 RepID=UPI003863C3D2|nr:helicase-related protein [Streptosporangium sp. NBC_01639]
MDDGDNVMGVRLEQLAPGSLISGVVPDLAVTIIRADWRGSNAVELVYKDDSGAYDTVILYREHETTLRLASPLISHTFDGDPQALRLAAEALRLRMAGLFDPMLAVATSEVEPLPHQLRAVYGELLPRSPLRFLLADDPGAGKTIMAGLYIKELLLRGDLERCLIVAPGSLVDQWQAELLEKFDLHFEVFTRGLAESGAGGLDRHPRLIARMDQLSRSTDLQETVRQTDWDLVVVDEAHRMAAHWYGGELKTTRRYQLGQLLEQCARHLLLMTATPHAGKEEDFQLFLALLDADRFEGRYRQGAHEVDYDGLIRRMLKEELLTFEGKPLFPERRAYTVPYPLSPLEQELYDAVTAYVRLEMNRADRLRQSGDSRRGNTVGFALTVLQRRLASSPEAILRSLQRRRGRLELRKQELLTGRSQPRGSRSFDAVFGQGGLRGDDADVEARLDDLDGEELEALEEEVLDASTAARTVEELEAELNSLDDLVELATRVHRSGEDRKWAELNQLLQNQAEIRDSNGLPRKIIIFTEHRDTLTYLVGRIQGLLGHAEAVQAIHGGVSRTARRRVRELFTHDRDVRVLIATDAAGEGLNLQAAHLMVNYDLPWNPNRIEQRFGRIHRIGQQEVCHLWNLVAEGTREGAVFQRLLEKIEQQREAYRGRVFDVLGEAFEEQPLRQLLLEAIRYGDQPEVKARLDQIIDHTVGEGLEELLAAHALHREVLGERDVAETRIQLEEARARRLQPHYVESFFREAFQQLGGRLSEKEQGRYEISNVPALIRAHDRLNGRGAPVLRRYNRVTFDRSRLRVPERPDAALLAPGHPLVDSVVNLITERHAHTLRAGSVLIDRAELSEIPRLLVALTQQLIDGHRRPRTIDKRFDFVELRPDGTVTPGGPAPYLDYEPATPAEAETVAKLVNQLITEPWLANGFEEAALAWATEHAGPEYLREVTARVRPRLYRTRQQVTQRLTQEINYWDARYLELLDGEEIGRRQRLRPETAQRRARELEERLDRRLRELDLDEQLRLRPPQISGGALILPQGLLNRVLETTEVDRATAVRDQAAIRAVERRAVEAVMAAERSLGRSPEEMPPNHKGFDLRSWSADRGELFNLEVKGRTADADDFTITRNEVLHAKNTGERYRLALVRVSHLGPQYDEVRYLTEPFTETNTDDFNVTKFVFHWDRMWAKGGSPR